MNISAHMFWSSVELLTHIWTIWIIYWEAFDCYKRLTKLCRSFNKLNLACPHIVPITQYLSGKSTTTLYALAIWLGTCQNRSCQFQTKRLIVANKSHVLESVSCLKFESVANGIKEILPYSLKLQVMGTKQEVANFII